jgi:hypothetical protein
MVVPRRRAKAIPISYPLKREAAISATVLVFGRRQRRDAPQAQLAGVQNAPRHEVAGGWAPARQRALWRFNAGAALDGKREARTVTNFSVGGRRRRCELP